MNSLLNIPVLLGSGRTGRLSEKVAKYVFNFVKGAGFESQLVDIKEYGEPFTIGTTVKNPKIEFWRTIIKQAHGLLIVVPEYNHGYPGELKILLDGLYDEYKGLVVGVCAVSNGALGGSRMLENLRPVLTAFKMVPLQRAAYINAKAEFNDKGEPTDESVDRQIKGLLEQLAEFAVALKAIRPK